MLRKLHWLFMPTPSAALFAARTTAAALTALYLSMALQLEEPKWAMLTVFIVAQPISGMVLAKGAARFAGTLVAAVVAVILIALCGQAPVMFVGALALWLALCVFFATFFRNFRAYAFVLAGYTAAIIAVPATQAPGTVFTLAIARSTEITLGILCAGLSSLIFTPQAAGRAYFKGLNSVFSAIGRYLSELTGLGTEQDGTRVRSLINDILQLETLRGYARYDTPGFRARNRLARRLNYELVSLLTAAFTVEEQLPRGGSADASQPARAAARAELRPAARLMTRTAPPFGETLKQALLRAYERILAQARLPGIKRSTDEWVAISRLLDLANRLRAAVVMHDLLVTESEPRRQPRSQRFSTEIDTRQALRNAGRAFIAVALTAAVWMGTASDNGLIALILVSVFTTLFATRDNPVAAALPFARGVALAVITAFVYAFFCLPRIGAFPLLAASLSPVLFAGCLAIANPATAGSGTGFLVLLSVLLDLSNTGRPQAGAFLNNVLGVGLAITVVLLSFLLLWPSGPRNTVRRLLDGIFSDLADGFGAPRNEFETRMYDRLVRLLPHLDNTRPDDEILLQGALAAITIGMEGRRLNARLRNPAFPNTFRRQGFDLLNRLSDFVAAETDTLSPLIEEAERFGCALLAEADPMQDRPQRRLLVRTGVTARIISTTLQHNAAFFRTRGHPQAARESGLAHAV